MSVQICHTFSKTIPSVLRPCNGVRLRQSKATALFSTHAAIDLHRHFWDSFATRALIHGRHCDCKVLPLEEVQIDVSRDTKAQNQMMKNAHEDLFRHFRINASLRAMKRGDGILSTHFSLNDTANKSCMNQLSSSYGHQEMTLIDIHAARKAREQMHHHFWSAHRHRKERMDLEAKLQVSDSAKQELTSPHAVRPNQRRNHTPLPSTLEEISTEFSSHTHASSNYCAMAITEARPPFQIVDVNQAWTDLCGYSRTDAIGSTLKLLQGPETDVQAANELVHQLISDDSQTEYETVITNYRSDGRKFRNHIRVGRIKNENDEVINFVGLFNRLEDNDELII